MKSTLTPETFLTTESKFASEPVLTKELQAIYGQSCQKRAYISAEAARLIRQIRHAAAPTLLDQFFIAYPLRSAGGQSLMELAETLLRLPDPATGNRLVVEKIAGQSWASHLGGRQSILTRTATLGLMAAKAALNTPGLSQLAAPVIRVLTEGAIRTMAGSFVAAQTVEQALSKAKDAPHSFDMLGEAARTHEDAARYRQSYEHAIDTAAVNVGGDHGVSIKLSALHPRFEALCTEQVRGELIPIVQDLARRAMAKNVPLTLDAEEQDRLLLMLEIFAATYQSPELSGWDGLGLVVQAYGKRATAVIAYLDALSRHHGRSINVRLVKGAYWDAEIKYAQAQGHDDFPVFTDKAATDLSYLACMRLLLETEGRLFAQFATHNAHTLVAAHQLAKQAGATAYEFQRLYGMGAATHEALNTGRPSRIYAPVGPNKDLLAYLVRRLLENGASASFVAKLYDSSITPEDLAAHPKPKSKPKLGAKSHLNQPRDLFPDRPNARGWDISEPSVRDALFVPAPHVELPTGGASLALDQAQAWTAPWQARRDALLSAADLMERDAPTLMATLRDEAGKTLIDCVAEVREAVDFLRYYATQIHPKMRARGIITAISPWNFPLAIFTGQIAAALATGNGVIAKPAEPTPRIAAQAIALLHRAGVPKAALQLVPGTGSDVGYALTADPRIDGVVFTGSTATARRVSQTMADSLAPGTPLIAETGGLNVMIVDSSALNEQAVVDIVRSAFGSAGQRCSALRCLYVQEEALATLLPMLKGAMAALNVGDPSDLKTDIGPVITPQARDHILTHIATHRSKVLAQSPAPKTGLFVPPTLIKVGGIEDLQEEIFGPVLHIASYKLADLPKVTAAINASGYGLTFGLHSRLTAGAKDLTKNLHVGNAYINRDQIGAIVGSQPFGGEGLSGTGPKAGGPLYLQRFVTNPDKRLEPGTAISLPGPTGETNEYCLYPRAPIACLGPDTDAQIAAVQALGGEAVAAFSLEEALAKSVSGIVFWGAVDEARAISQKLAHLDGPLIPLITGMPDQAHCFHERHVCTNTAAAGGNATLLAMDSAGSQSSRPGD